MRFFYSEFIFHYNQSLKKNNDITINIIIININYKYYNYKNNFV